MWTHVQSIFRFRGDRGRRLIKQLFEYAFVQCRSYYIHHVKRAMGHRPLCGNPNLATMRPKHGFDRDYFPIGGENSLFLVDFFLPQYVQNNNL